MPRHEYDRHLASPKWAAFRQVALSIAKNRCRACAATEDLQVHHRTYDHFGHEELDDVVVLCQRCHDAVHRLERSGRLSLWDATNVVLHAGRGRAQPRPEFVKQRGRSNIDDFFAAEREHRRKRA